MLTYRAPSGTRSYATPAPDAGAVGSFNIDGVAAEYVVSWTQPSASVLRFTMTMPGNSAGWAAMAVGGNAMEGSDFMIVSVPSPGATPVVLDNHADSAADGAYVHPPPPPRPGHLSPRPLLSLALWWSRSSAWCLIYPSFLVFKGTDTSCSDQCPTRNTTSSW